MERECLAEFHLRLCPASSLEHLERPCGMVFSVEPIGHEYLPKYVMWISVGSHPLSRVAGHKWPILAHPSAWIIQCKEKMNCLQLSTCRRSLLAVLTLIMITGCTPQPDGNGLGARAQAAADRQRAELMTLYKETLRDPSADRSPSTRRAAAVALLVEGSNDAMETLSNAMNSGDSTQVQSVLEALSTQDRPEPRLENAALMAIGDCPPDQSVRP